jgi:ribose/xylose/arabinose/galactoside ABC-type transport system permease subunit
VELETILSVTSTHRQPRARRRSLSELAGRYIAYIALVALVIIFGALAPSLFLSWGNLSTILQNSAVLCLVSVGMTFVIIVGSIDLSVGSVMAVSGVIAAMATPSLGWLAFLIAPTVGALFGLANGAMFVFGKIPSFVATLGMLSVARGLTVIVTGGAPVAIPLDSSFYSVGTPPIPFIIVIVFALIFGAILTQTRFGEYALAIGGAEDKARVLGLPVKKLKILIFILSGLMAGLGGGVLTSQLGSGSPTSGIGFELLAISAVVIGGTPLTGGMGSILGTIVGSLVISILANGMIILGISTNVQTVLTGVVLVAAVLLSIQRDKLRVIK